MKKIIIISCVSLLLSSCVLTDLMDKTTKITEVILSSCNCDDVRLLSYEDDFKGNVTAYVEVVGTNIEEQTETSLRINDSLKANIPDYCDIDNLTLDFIKRGKHNKITIRNCEVKN